uniref:Lrp/AsnC family transcriptional regulator n=1 Tax=Fervidicoccus fontis TaxID=683846 RepID=A0A7J3ZL25_9CREN
MRERTRKSTVDEKDIKLLELLKKNSRLSYDKIAKQLGISKAAVKKRLTKLIEGGVIKRFTIEYEIESKMKALVLVKVMPGHDVPSVASAIVKNEMVDSVFEVAGEYDIVVLASTPDVASINQLIDSMRRVQGVASTNTLVVLRSW